MAEMRHPAARSSALAALNGGKKPRKEFLGDPNTLSEGIRHLYPKDLTEKQKKAIQAGAARAWYADLPGAVVDIPAMALEYGAEGLKRLLPKNLGGYDFAKELGVEAFQEGMRKPAGGSRHLEELGEGIGIIPPTTGMKEEDISRLAFGFLDPVPLGAIGAMRQAPKFTSPAVKAVSEIKQTKMPPNQWISQMRGRGVKQDELYWTGVEDWLKSKKGSVTKQELDEYLEANQIQVQEVVYGGPIPAADFYKARGEPFTPGNLVEDYVNVRRDWGDFDIYQHPKHGYWLVGNEDEMDVILESPHDLGSSKFATEDDARDGLERMLRADANEMDQNELMAATTLYGPTKFASQVLPGGENYRELVLHYPNPKLQKAAKDVKEFEAQFESKPIPHEFKNEIQELETQIAQLQTQMDTPVQTAGPFVESVPQGDKNSALIQKIQDLNLKKFELEKYAAEHERLRQAVGEAKEGFPTFTEGHFDEPNTIAWIRFNERTDADGKRVLFIEEIQSDWGHKGLEEGFRGTEKTERYIVEEETDEFGETFFDITDTSTGMPAEVHQTREAAQDAADQFNRGETMSFEGAGKVPAGPFVMDTHQWTALTLKRMVRWASDNDFDSIAWTTGKQQADRYNLSKQVDGIEVVDLGAENVEILAKLKGEDFYTTLEAGVPREKLSDHIGKELADKALKELERQSIEEGVRVAQPSWKFPRTVENLSKQVAGVAQFEGIDLELGGDYVKFIYDDVLPAQAKKLGKKYGAKVETSDVGTAHTLRPVTGPPGTWHVYDPIIEDYWMDPETLRIPSFNSREEAAAVIKGKAKGEKVWSMNLTDKLKQAAKDGLPYYVALPPVMAGAMKEEEPGPDISARAAARPAYAQ